MSLNRVDLGGELIALEPLRYTPAGIAVVDFKINHASEQIEANNPCKITCEVIAMAVGEIATMISQHKNGEKIKVRGFLSKRSARNTQLILHVNEVRFN